MGILLLVVFAVVAFLLILIVLMQDEQGEGLGGIFGGGSSTPFGSRSGNVLTRFTSILGALFLLTAFGLAWINKSTDVGDITKAAQKEETVINSDEWWSENAAEEAAPESAEVLEAEVTE